MISREKKEEYLLLVSQINNMLVEGRPNFDGVRNRLLALEDLVEDTKQVPFDMKSAFIVRISEVRSELSLKTENKAINAFDTLVIELFRFLNIRLPKKTLKERIENYLYPEFRDDEFYQK
jgi:hypothetical protein